MCVSGVPQGSILGPLFFLLYINDMINVSNTLFLILFADDSNAFIIGKNINHIIHQLNDELHKLTEWLVANRLTLNLKKTHYVIFSSAKNNKHIYDDLIINNKVIDRVVSTKFLGVIIDAQLKFREHIAQIKGKIARGIGILCRAKKFFNIKTLTDLYYSFVHPYLSYCVEFWGNTNTAYINPLIKLQKHAVRIITGANQLCSTAVIFKMLKIIPLAKLKWLTLSSLQLSPQCLYSIAMSMIMTHVRLITFMLTLFIVISALSVSAIKLQHCTTALMASTTMYHINVSST